MNGFETHGIDHLSASSLNLFVAQPALWVMERLLKRSAPVGAAAHRGSAIERGIELGLFDHDIVQQDCQAAALKEFDRLTALSGDPNREKERGIVADAVAVGLHELRQYGTPTPPAEGRQHRIQITLDEISVPLIGYLDFVYDIHGIVIDLKTEHRLSSAIRGAHARQGAVYARAKSNYQMRFAYVTPKKVGVYVLENPDRHLEALRRVALTLERFLRVSADPAELAALICPDFESFYWNNPVARANGLAVFGF